NIAGTTALDQAALPNFAAAVGNLDLTDLVGLVIEGLDRVLAQIEKRFDLPNLPLIGDDLGKATAFLSTIRERIIGKLEELTNLTEGAVRAKLFEALGPSGLGYLADRNGDNKVTPADIAVNFSTSEKRADIDFRLAGSYAVGTPIALDLGLDGLGLAVDADL